MKYLFKFIKKHKFIYKFLTIILKFTIYRKLFFKPFQEKEIFILNTKFFYPKNSAVYSKFFKDFDLDYKKKLDFQYSILNDKYNFNNIDCIIDVGSNFGYQSLYYNNKYNKKIICFEPSSLNFHFLKKNLKNFENIILYNLALGDKKTNLKLSIPTFEKHRPSNLGLFTLREEIQSDFLSEYAKVEKFDNLDSNLNNYEKYYIKIDVEGFEYEVLMGMQNLINKKFCLLKIELNWNYFSIKRLNNIYNFFSSRNYHAYLFDNEKKNLIKVTRDELISKLETNTYDVVFGKN